MSNTLFLLKERSTQDSISLLLQLLLQLASQRLSFSDFRLGKFELKWTKSKKGWQSAKLDSSVVHVPTTEDLILSIVETNRGNDLSGLFAMIRPPEVALVYQSVFELFYDTPPSFKHFLFLKELGQHIHNFNFHARFPFNGTDAIVQRCLQKIKLQTV